jgi:hypothetical protein
VKPAAVDGDRSERWPQRLNPETVLLVINRTTSSDAKGVVTSKLIPTLDTIDAEIG